MTAAGPGRTYGLPVTTTALVTDSTSYLPPGLADALGITVVSMHVVLDGRSVPEVELDPAEFYRRLRAGATPTTSQPAPGEFLQAYDAAGAERVLCVTAAAALSGSHQSALLAAGMTDLPVDVVDSGTIGGGLCLVVLETARGLAAGASHDEALALARSLGGRVASTWSSDTTALLAAGGRLPDDVPEGIAVFALDGGQVRVLGAARSVEESIDFQVDVIRAAAAQSPTRVTVGHGDAAELADALVVALSGVDGVLGIDRYVTGPVVAAHAGTGNVGASYLRAAG